jgi:hypothetical protein
MRNSFLPNINAQISQNTIVIYNTTFKGIKCNADNSLDAVCSE